MILNSNYYKSYYIRGKIYQQINENEKSKEDFIDALKLCNQVKI